MKLEQIVTFSGTIHCVSGLCIGGSSSTLDIGGIGQEVIKNPITKEPYIPGSSLKGKMRSELEKKYGSLKWIDDKQNGQLKVREENKKYSKILVPNNDTPCECGRNTCPICLIFGAHNNFKAHSTPTRIIVRDAVLCKDMLGNAPLILERKTENIILRDSNTAGSPRTIERVPAGTSFKLEIVLRIFEGDDKNDLVSKVEEGLELVGKSYLGGGGSRGSGHVEFSYEITYDWIQPKPISSV